MSTKGTQNPKHGPVLRNPEKPHTFSPWFAYFTSSENKIFDVLQRLPQERIHSFHYSILQGRIKPVKEAKPISFQKIQFPNSFRRLSVKRMFLAWGLSSSGGLEEDFGKCICSVAHSYSRFLMQPRLNMCSIIIQACRESEHINIYFIKEIL